MIILHSAAFTQVWSTLDNMQLTLECTLYMYNVYCTMYNVHWAVCTVKRFAVNPGHTHPYSEGCVICGNFWVTQYSTKNVLGDPEVTTNICKSRNLSNMDMYVQDLPQILLHKMGHHFLDIQYKRTRQYRFAVISETPVTYCMIVTV